MAALRNLLLTATFGFAALSVSAPVSAVTIVNGDFETGNSGFTSAYTYVAPVAGSNSGSAQYTVSTNASPWNTNFRSFGDHTTGSGNFMIVNGAVSPIAVWSNAAPILLAAGEYVFSFWLAGACCTTSWNEGSGPGVDVAPAELWVALNGDLISSQSAAVRPGAAGVWDEVSISFNIPTEMTATFSILNYQIAPNGNDFALDDISLAPIPEPSTWGLMLAGLGAVGVMLRRRRTAA